MAGFLPGHMISHVKLITRNHPSSSFNTSLFQQFKLSWIIPRKTRDGKHWYEEEQLRTNMDWHLLLAKILEVPFLCEGEARAMPHCLDAAAKPIPLLPPTGTTRSVGANTTATLAISSKLGLQFCCPQFGKSRVESRVEMSGLRRSWGHCFCSFSVRD